MKYFLILLVCVSLVFAKPTKDKAEINGFSEKKILSSVLNLSENIKNNEFCYYCYENFYELHRAFQNPLYKRIFLEKAREKCQTERCYQIIKTFVESVASNTNPYEGCAFACQRRFESLLEKSIEKTALNKFFSTNENFRQVNDITCDFCYQNFDQLHEAFQNPLFKEIFLTKAKEQCPNEECYRKIKAFVEIVSVETDPKKACSIVCIT